MSEGFAHNPRTLFHIAPYLRSRGVSPTEIFRRADISPAALLDANGWVPRELCFKLGDALFAATGEVFPGAAIGRRFKLADLGTWGLAVSGAPTLRQACQAAVSGIGLIHRGTDLRLRTNGRYVVLDFAYAGRSSFEPQQHILGSLAVLRSAALLAGVPEAVGARFSKAYGRSSEQLEETFGPSLEFGCERDGIKIDRAILDFPMPPANGASNYIDPVETPANLTALVKAMLPYDVVTIDRVATLLRMSTRTLQRRLRDWGFSFEEIMDDVRRLEAMRRIAAREPAAEVAFMLGYSDQAHFTRAFRRWTGLAPRQYARELAKKMHSES